MPSKNLNQAKKQKKDEFYTQLEDINRELVHYKEHFKGKTVLCNCDDPKVSNFFVYFVRNFAELGLKRLITTCYKNCQPALFSENKDEHAVWLDYRGGDDNNLDITAIQATAKPLKQDGDFRSEECVELLKEADIVVTNPPFSLFKEYLAQLVKYNKKFIIIGNQNALTLKEIFPLVKNNQIWLGYGFSGGAGHFINTHYEDYATASDHREGMIRVSGIIWLTNLEIKKRTEPLILYKKYTPEEYPKYDNYDAININKTVDIPIDYDGVMGVPITFLDKYCPDQFEIIWIASGHTKTSIPEECAKIVGFKPNVKSNCGTTGYGIVNGVQMYHRILIRKKQ